MQSRLQRSALEKIIPQLVDTSVRVCLLSSYLPLPKLQVLNPFLRGLGVPKNWGFCDIYGNVPNLWVNSMVN